jgi:hypothetical protein
VRESRKLKTHRYTIVKLSEPIQQGWRRFHVLTEHARRRRDAETLEAILNLIGTERESRRPDFRVKQRRMKRLIEVGQPLRRISEWERNRESVPWIGCDTFMSITTGNGGGALFTSSSRNLIFLNFG